MLSNSKTEFDKQMDKKRVMREPYQHRLLVIRNIIELIQDRKTVRAGQLLVILVSWPYIYKYLNYLLECGIIFESIDKRRRTKRRGYRNYFSLTEKGYLLLYKIRHLEQYCKLEKFT
mgnify:CR=1 FL=1